VIESRWKICYQHAERYFKEMNDRGWSVVQRAIHVVPVDASDWTVKEEGGGHADPRACHQFRRTT
jgi:hypothetical protein